MDDATREMLLEAYEETCREALGGGMGPDTAHAEGLTAAAMLLAATRGIQDDEARAIIDGLGFALEDA